MPWRCPLIRSLATLEGLRESFEAAHDARYGYRLGKAVSMVRLRLTVRTAPALNGDLPDASGEKVTSSLTPWPVEGHGEVQRVTRFRASNGRRNSGTSDYSGEYGHPLG